MREAPLRLPFVFKGEGNHMDPQIITYGCGAMLLAVLAVSYIRTKRDGSGNAPIPPTMKGIVDETRNCLGLESAEHQSELVRTFDLAPLQMASALLSPKEPQSSTKNDAQEGR